MAYLYACKSSSIKSFGEIPLENNCNSIICLNGTVTAPKISLPIIAADGAYNKLAKLAITPDYLVGDFDSVIGEIAQNSKIHRIENKDTTDFEKCIQFASKLKLYPCLVLGAFGGEIDHELHNINLMLQYQKTCPMIMLNQTQTIRVLPPKLTIKTSPNQIISIIPKPEAFITTKGLNWEVNYKLTQFGPSSVRNFATGKQVEITCKGQALLIC